MCSLKSIFGPYSKDNQNVNYDPNHRAQPEGHQKQHSASRCTDEGKQEGHCYMNDYR